MAPDARVIELAAIWWRKACDDWEAAQRTSDLPFPCGFHCQQAVEKAIKAILVFHQIDFAKSHDIGALLELLRGVPMVPPDQTVRGLEALTRYAVDTRYPPGEARPREAKAALAMARRFLKWAQRQLPVAKRSAE